MKMTESNILECLPETITNQFDFSGVYVDAAGESHNLTIFDTSYFIMHLYQLQANRKIMVDKDAPSTYLVSLFNTWKNSRKDLFLKQAYAYTLKYNPIENYSSLEQMTNDQTVHLKGTTDTQETTPYTKEETEISPFTKEETKTTYPVKTEETTPYTNETTTIGSNNDQAPTNSTTNSVKGFNSSDWSNTEKSEVNINTKEVLTKTGKEKIETSYDVPETVELTKTGTEKHTLTKTGKEKVETLHRGNDTDTRNYTLTRKGNIGVMTPAEMLQKEFDGLIQDLAFRAFSEFIDRFTYYSEGVI